jgi:4-hydroxyacetophenone monooxygenase
MLMNNGWYRMLKKENVCLVSDPITEIRDNRIITKGGSEYESDVLVLATGFDVLRFLTAFEARGRSGRSLREVWEDDNARAYLGLTIPDLPNFFCLMDPICNRATAGASCSLRKCRFVTSWIYCERC